MSEPRPVVLTLAMVRSLTVLEIARASVLAGVPRGDSERLLRAWADPHGDPGEVERGALQLYAWAYMIERRADPSLTWDEAQTWAVTFAVADSVDPIAEAEAEASVEAAIATGLAPDVAGQLTVAQTEAYIAKGRELAAAAGRRR